MDKVTVITRQQIADHLRASKKFLQMSFEDSESKRVHVCNAVNTDPNLQVAGIIKDIIRKRLNGYHTVCGWLRTQNIDAFSVSFDYMQRYRLAWMDFMIAEFENTEHIPKFRGIPITTWLNALNSIDPSKETAGICFLVSRYLIENTEGTFSPNNVSYFLKPIFVSWPKYSGTSNYPVPHKNGVRSTIAAFRNATNKWEGEYGESRKELLQYLKDHFKAEYERLAYW